MNQVPPVTTRGAAQLEIPNEPRGNCLHSINTFMAYRMQTLALVTLCLEFHPKASLTSGPSFEALSTQSRHPRLTFKRLSKLLLSSQRSS